MRAAIVGGSLGGLTAALLLSELGIDVDVYERSPVELAQRGAGIGFLPESQRYLIERGNIALDDISVATGRVRYLNRAGSVIYDEARAHRFSSWNTVFRELRTRFPNERYHLNHEMSGWHSDAERVRVQFANGAACEADLLIGADGVGSLTRARLLPHVQPAYAGYVAWRGMVPEAELDAATRAAFDDAITYYVYANSHILVYPIPSVDGSVTPGERLINWVWYRNYLHGSDLDDVLTDASGQRRDISLPPGTASKRHVAEVHAVAGARLPPPHARLVQATAQPFLQVIYDIEVPQMAFERICLVGDAAFAARPHAAAGTSKAAADGWALYEAFKRSGVAAAKAAAQVPHILKAWEPGQLALGKQLLERTRTIGRRSQVDGTWVPGDPALVFGLRGPGL